MPKPSLGVIFHPTFPPETLIDYARRAEAAGFDELWLWEDCFWAGALTSAAVVLGNTQRIKVGIGLMPATVRNPLFVAMEITTLARLYPDRFLPGFGHGVDSWMKQIGAAPKSTLRALEDTVVAVRGLLRGESVTLESDPVHLEHVQMSLTAPQPPPLYIGAMREKSLQLAGRVGDGTILTELSSPAYVRWARAIIEAGMSETGRNANQVVVYVTTKLGPGSREALRDFLAPRFSWAQPHLQALGIAEAAARMLQEQGVEGTARNMPEAWLDELCAAGTPEQAAHSLQHLAEAGADSIVLQPIPNDSGSLTEYIDQLLPLLK